MKANEVLRLLKITRQTLCIYVKKQKVKATLLCNGLYDYDKHSVYQLFNKEIQRSNVIYCRVSTSKQKNDLDNQRSLLKEFCAKNGIVVNDEYCDIGSGINFDRKEFQRLLMNVIAHKVDCVYITYKDRLSRISFKMFEGLFAQFNCKIVVLSETDDAKETEKEIFHEIIDLIHCFSMKVYSNRRKQKLSLLEKDLQLETATQE